MEFEEEKISDFLSLFEERKLKIRNTQGCNYLELWQDETDKNVYYSYSIWDSVDDLNNYRNSEFFQDTWLKFKSWFKNKPQVFSTNKIEIV